jgi:hypothetical protein
VSHGRCDTGARWGMSVKCTWCCVRALYPHTVAVKFIAASFLKRLRGGRSASEAAVRWLQLQKRNQHLDPEPAKKPVGATKE